MSGQVWTRRNDEVYFVMTLRVQSDVRIKLNCDMPRKNEVIKDLQSQLEEAHGKVGMGNPLFPGLRAR